MLFRVEGDGELFERELWPGEAEELVGGGASAMEGAVLGRQEPYAEVSLHRQYLQACRGSGNSTIQ